MLKKDFWYDLPKELIAQEPADPRDSARLMVLSQKDDSIQHKIFHDLPEFFRAGRLLVGKQFQGPACPHRGRQAANRCCV